MVLRVDKARQIAGCEWTGAMGNEIDLWRRAAVEVGPVPQAVPQVILNVLLRCSGYNLAAIDKLVSFIL